MTYREPPIDSVIRELCKAVELAESRCVVLPVITAIHAALNAAWKEQDRQSKRRKQ